MDSLIIFDTTMRDGEQSPGASMTREEKLRIARALERMRVDVIEAGFPAASNGDFEAVKAVAAMIKNSTVAGLCRARDKDIQRGLDALGHLLLGAAIGQFRDHVPRVPFAQRVQDCRLALHHLI